MNNLSNKYNQLVLRKEKICKISQNVAERPHNITCVLNNFKSLLKQVYEKGCTEKINNKNDPNSYAKSDLSNTQEKLPTLK